MSTLEDLRADAMREAMLDECEALHVDGPVEGCPGCEERAQRELEDAQAEAADAYFDRCCGQYLESGECCAAVYGEARLR